MALVYVIVWDTIKNEFKISVTKRSDDEEDVQILKKHVINANKFMNEQSPLTKIVESLTEGVKELKSLKSLKQIVPDLFK